VTRVIYSGGGGGCSFPVILVQFIVLELCVKMVVVVDYIHDHPDLYDHVLVLLFVR
jgi:hypothetical protein